MDHINTQSSHYSALFSLVEGWQCLKSIWMMFVCAEQIESQWGLWLRHSPSWAQEPPWGSPFREIWLCCTHQCQVMRMLLQVLVWVLRLQTSCEYIFYMGTGEVMVASWGPLLLSWVGGFFSADIFNKIDHIVCWCNDAVIWETGPGENHHLYYSY